MENRVNIWGFDIGKGSLGEAVRIGSEIKHVQSLILYKDFGEIKTAAEIRRQYRTRRAHRAREKFLEKVLGECGIEVLRRREVGIVDGCWKLIAKGDIRLEKEFPSPGEDVCYNSIALRCKLLLGEPLESWQVFKALNSAIQNRGYDPDIPWTETDADKKEDSDWAKKLSAYEDEKKVLFSGLADPQRYDYPCFFKAYKMGLWSPEDPEIVKLRIDNHAEKAKNYVIPRKCVEAEFEKLVENASLQYPKLKGKALYIMFGPAQKEYASLNPELRRQFNLKRGADTDWTALGQKIPRFDNRIVDKCKLMPRFNVCKIRPLDEIKNPADFLPYEITTLMKLLNLRFLRNGTIESLACDELKEAFELARDNKYKLSKTALKKFLKKIGAEVLDEDQSKIEAPRSGGRASFSRPAMAVLKELILSGESPAKFYARKVSQIENADKLKGLVASDFDFIKQMGDIAWGKIFIPDMRLLEFANRQNIDAEARINKLIGSQNDPIVRHRLGFFYDRIKFLESKFGVPDKIVIEFVRDDFLGEKARKEYQKAINERFKEKQELAKEMDEAGYKGAKMLLKLELYKKQGGQCVYTGEALPSSEIASLEIEHIVPRSRGGPDSIYNYVLTRERTNKEKADRTPYEWLSRDQQRWNEYVSRVNSLYKSLGGKRCKLLLANNAEELVDKYTALAETAWISKLAQQVVCLHFGFQFGGMEGQRRVFCIPGGVTARIRGMFGLNELLHVKDYDTDSMSETEIVELHKRLEKKNRENKKHHALDAMCLCFAPTGSQIKRFDAKTIMPEGILGREKQYFKSYLDKIVPNEVATQKPRLEQTLYSKRVVGGKECIVRKFNLVDLAYKSGLKPVYDLQTIKKLVGKDQSESDIINPVVGALVREFIATDPTEEQWRAWCGEVCMPSESFTGSRIKRVLVRCGNPDEFKDLSKDGCGAYRKGDAHKGQIVWRSTNGKCYVLPIYVHASKYGLIEALKKRADFKEIVGLFRMHCLVNIERDVFDKKGQKLLPPGIYMLNTIMTKGTAVLTNTDGVKQKEVNMNYLVESGMRPIKVDY